MYAYRRCVGGYNAISRMRNRKAPENKERRRAVAITWEQVRAKRPPREDRVAEHRARMDAEAHAYRLGEIPEEQGLTQSENTETPEN